jgi:hypothetical protein
MVNEIKLFSIKLLSVYSCSHVGHIYRGPRRRSMHPRGGNVFQSHINHLRVAEVLNFN